jgi:signal transduction histidine kinase
MRTFRNWTPPATTIDVLVASIVAFPTFMDAGWNQQGTRQADWMTFTLAGVAVGSLLWRRRWPLGVSLVCGAVLSTWYLMDHHGELLNLPAMVGLYTVAVQGNRRRTVIVGTIASAWFGGLAEVAGSPIGSPVLEMLWPLVPLALGEAVRARHELLAEYAARAARAEADREREARHRVEAERVRIAREFHDVVAHTMAAVNVQMGVAVAAFDTQPDTARRALVQARASSKEALHELRATVALLRDSSPTNPSTPAPRIAQIDELADTARAAGVAVTIHDHTTDQQLPAAVELAAYRIVQEALTNVIRHADADHAAVSLTHDHHGLVVEIVDDGSAGARPGPSTRGPIDQNGAGRADSGHGLVGMTERAAVLGGSVEHGPGPAGGFRVRAVLPSQVGGL